jgi:hypothetical protein
MTILKPILIEEYTSEGNPESALRTNQRLCVYRKTGKPLVFKTGLAQFLGEFALQDSRLVIELAHIDGGGEGALPTIAALAEKYARQNNIAAVEWIVHSVRCANPNPQLRRVLERRGFHIQDLPGYGQAFYLRRGLPT